LGPHSDAAEPGRGDQHGQITQGKAPARGNGAAPAARRHRRARSCWSCKAAGRSCVPGRVYQRLHEAGIEPDWVIGHSVGAINGALIAGNTPATASTACTRFWERVEQRAGSAFGIHPGSAARSPT